MGCVCLPAAMRGVYLQSFGNGLFELAHGSGAFLITENLTLPGFRALCTGRLHLAPVLSSLRAAAHRAANALDCLDFSLAAALRFLTLCCEHIEQALLFALAILRTQGGTWSGALGWRRHFEWRSHRPWNFVVADRRSALGRPCRSICKPRRRLRHRCRQRSANKVHVSNAGRTSRAHNHWIPRQ